MVEVSVVIPMLNNVAITQKCLDAVRANTPTIYELILVADDSTPETCEWLMKQHLEHGVRLVLDWERNNFSGAVNMGIKVAKAPYVAIITNDVYVEPGWLEPLLLALKFNPQFGWVTSRIIQPDNAWRPFNIACCLLSREAIDKVGLLDEAFKAGKGHEDDDWYWRFLKAGYKPTGIFESVASHPEAESTFKAEHKDRVEQMHKTNQQIFYQKWGFVGTVWGNIPCLDSQERKNIGAVRGGSRDDIA